MLIIICLIGAYVAIIGIVKAVFDWKGSKWDKQKPWEVEEVQRIIDEPFKKKDAANI